MTTPAIEHPGVELAPDTTPARTATALLVGAVAWNLLVVLLADVARAMWRDGTGGAVPVTVMAVVFAIVGVGLIALVPNRLRALVRPRLRLWLDPGALHLGGTASLIWALDGSPGGIDRLVLTLEGEEYLPNYEVSTADPDRSRFFQREIARIQNGPGVTRGTVPVAVPIGTMHSFTAPGARIEWRVRCTGEAARGPRLDVAFPVVVSPAPGIAS
ncbi:MAG: hypothetical protein R2752_05500 [Vicinamibacterales bacterium]